MCTRNSGQSRRKRRICSRRQVCSAELRLMTMEEGTAVLESYTVVRTSGVANQDGRCLSVPSVRPMSWFDLEQACEFINSLPGELLKDGIKEAAKVALVGTPMLAFAQFLQRRGKETANKSITWSGEA